MLLVGTAGALPGGAAVLLGAATAVAVALAAGHRLPVAVLCAALLGTALAALDVPDPAVALVPWAVVLAAYGCFTRQCADEVGDTLRRLRRVSRPDLPALLDLARAAADAGAAVASRWWRSDALRVREKAASDDLVSQADTETEAAVRDVLLGARPQDALLGEEGGSRDGSSGVRWVVDPVDGTTNYLYDRPDWAVSVAATDAEGRLLVGVVVEPALGLATWASAGGGTWTSSGRAAPLQQTDLTRALVELDLGLPAQKVSAGRVVDALVPRVRDVRRGGSAASALAQVATGRADAAWVPGLQPWDCAAGVLLVLEAGGVVGDLDGPTPGRVPASGDVLAAPPALWEPLQALLAPAHRPGHTGVRPGPATVSLGGV